MIMGLLLVLVSCCCMTTDAASIELLALWLSVRHQLTAVADVS
jgi:hypothetical protein